MRSGVRNRFVIRAWEEIVRISARQVYKKTGKKYVKTYQLPTLSNMAVWMSYCDWESSPVDEVEFLELIGVFHSKFVDEYSDS